MQLKRIFEDIVRELDPDGCIYSSGYCMDLALAFGTALEDVGIDTQYWEYGSVDEPQVHIGVEALGIFFDNSLTWDKDEASSVGNFYADTELSWKPISKKSIDGYVPPKRYRDPTFDPEANIRNSELYALFAAELNKERPMERQQEMSTKVDHAVFGAMKLLMQSPGMRPKDALRKIAMVSNMPYNTIAQAVLQFCETIVDDL